MEKTDNVVLYYFPVKANGEGIRMLLAYGGQDFEDKRVTSEEWAVLKPKTPFGQMPVLEVNGKMYAQSFAIGRYLGRKFGIAGDSIEDELEIDQNLDFHKDIRTKATTVAMMSDPEQKKKAHEDLAKNYYPQVLEILHNIVTKNNGHIALGKLTWADFLVAGFHGAFKMMLQIPDFDEKYPNLKKLHDNVVSLPGVKEFVAAAPKSDF